MNLLAGTHHLDYIAPSGHTLPLEQRAALQCSLPLLKRNLKLHHVYFWGKVFGVEKDYLIAQGFGRDMFAGKRTFVSHDGVEWVQLPDIDSATAALADQVRGRFSGDASTEYSIPVDVGDAAPPAAPAPSTDEGNDDADNEDSAKKATTSRPVIIIREEKRLVRLVQLIDHDTSPVPRGALVLTADNSVIANTAFQGLSAAESVSLASYGHLRPAENLSRKSLLEREHLSRTLDFLDTLPEDIPKGLSWTVRRDPTSNLVTIRSLLWPGAFAYHVAHTANFGFVYFGFGEKNIDIGFSL